MEIVATAARLTHMVTSALVVGDWVFRWIVSPRLEAPSRDGRLTRLACVALLAASGVGLTLETVALTPDDGRVLDTLGAIGRTAYGTAWIVQAIAALCLIGARSLGRAIHATTVGLIAVSPAFMGHAIATPEWRNAAVFADAAHLLAVGLWGGTLAVLTRFVFSRGDASTPRALEVFSPLALGAAGVLVVTGAFAAWLHIPTWSDLVVSDYGRLLLLKIALLLGVLALGAVNWRRLTPKIQRGAGQSDLYRSARLELTLMIGVLVVTAILVATPLPGE